MGMHEQYRILKWKRIVVQLILKMANQNGTAKSENQ